MSTRYFSLEEAKLMREGRRNGSTSVEREVYLCGLRGEDAIRFWHETDAGFAGGMAGHSS